MDKDIGLRIKVLKIGFKMRFKGNVCKSKVIGKKEFCYMGKLEIGQFLYIKMIYNIRA